MSPWNKCFFETYPPGHSQRHTPQEFPPLLQNFNVATSCFIANLIILYYYTFFLALCQYFFRKFLLNFYKNFWRTIADFLKSQTSKFSSKSASLFLCQISYRNLCTKYWRTALFIFLKYYFKYAIIIISFLIINSKNGGLYVWKSWMLLSHLCLVETQHLAEKWNLQTYWKASDSS